MKAKSIHFDPETIARVNNLARVNRRSFSAQVAYMVERQLSAEDCGEAKQLKQDMEGQP